MTNENQNHWASHLEDATQKEIRQMAKYAIDHLKEIGDLSRLQSYLLLAIRAVKGAELPESL